MNTKKIVSGVGAGLLGTLVLIQDGYASSQRSSQSRRGKRNQSRVAPSGRRLTAQEQANFGLRKGVATGNLALVFDAIKRGADINDRGPHSGMTALDHAQAEGHQEIVNYLIAHGARPVPPPLPTPNYPKAPPLDAPPPPPLQPYQIWDPYRGWVWVYPSN